MNWIKTYEPPITINVFSSKCFIQASQSVECLGTWKVSHYFVTRWLTVSIVSIIIDDHSKNDQMIVY